MTKDTRNEIRHAVLSTMDVNIPQSFREIATAVRTLPTDSRSLRDSEILSVIYPMINSGELQYTSDLKLEKSSTEA
jgi:hypothetical protein